MTSCFCFFYYKLHLAHISALWDISRFTLLFPTVNTKNSEDKVWFHHYGQLRCKSPKMTQKAERLLGLDSGMFVVETCLSLSKPIICDITDESNFSHPLKVKA